MTFEKGLLCFQVCFSSCVVHSLYCIISSYGHCVYTNWVIRWHQRASHHRNTIVTEMTNFWFGLEIVIFFIVFILTSVISLIGNLFYDQLTVDYALILISVMKNDLTTHKVSAAFISVVGPFQEICQCSQTSVCDIASGGFVLLLHLWWRMYFYTKLSLYYVHYEADLVAGAAAVGTHCSPRVPLCIGPLLLAVVLQGLM